MSVTNEESTDDEAAYRVEFICEGIQCHTEWSSKSKAVKREMVLAGVEGVWKTEVVSNGNQ